MKHTKIKERLNENDHHGNVTVLYPGGFKPMTGGHLDLIKRYASNPQVKEVRVLVGRKERNGIDQTLAVTIANELTSQFSNVKIVKVQDPTPTGRAYKEIETAEPGNFALAASSKGDDYVRVKAFTDQHQPGGKYHEGLPEGVNIVELPIDAEPAVFRYGSHKGQPISASTLRTDLAHGNWDGFESGYPDSDSNQVEDVWDMLQGVVNESYQYGYINESVVSKVNKHMTHAEDLVVLGGEEGMDWVLKMIWDLYQELKGNTPKDEMKLSVKIDGAPAIFAWSTFPGLPDNGIAMKGLFAKTPKVFTNDDDVDANPQFEGKEDLKYKLKTFIKHLPEINVPEGEIWQGDFIFDNKSLSETEIDGEKFIGFHPNAIYYVVPKDSDLGQDIKKAEVGIAWHTRYTGNNLESISANYNTSSDELTKTESMFMTDPYIKSFAGIVTFTEEESLHVEDTMEKLLDISKNFKTGDVYKNILESKDIISYFTIFQNSLVRANTQMTNPDGFFGEFVEFLQNKASVAVEKMKSPAGKEKKELYFAEMIDRVQQNKDEWYLVIHSIMEITKLKNMFVKKLSNLGEFQTYLKMKEGGLRGTNQEGFAVSDIDGNVVKLVDRNEFSWSNFSPAVQKGWEH